MRTTLSTVVVALSVTTLATVVPASPAAADRKPTAHADLEAGMQRMHDEMPPGMQRLHGQMMTGLAVEQTHQMMSGQAAADMHAMVRSGTTARRP